MCIESKGAKRRITYTAGENADSFWYQHESYFYSTLGQGVGHPADADIPLLAGQSLTLTRRANNVSGNFEVGSDETGKGFSFTVDDPFPANTQITLVAHFTVSMPGVALTFDQSRSSSWSLSSPSGTSNLTKQFRLVSSTSSSSSFEYVLSFTSSVELHSFYVKYASIYFTTPGNNKNTNFTVTFDDCMAYYEVDETEQDVLEDIRDNTKGTLEESKEQTETQKGIFSSIKEFFGSFFQNLIDSVIGLFVPGADEMSDLLGQLNDFFSEKFGFLYAPFDYLIQLIGVFTGSSGTTGLTFPGFSLMGHEVWPEYTYDIAGDPVAGKVLEYVRIGTGVLLAGWFIMYLQDFFKERFGKG